MKICDVHTTVYQMILKINALFKSFRLSVPVKDGLDDLRHVRHYHNRHKITLIS